MYVAAPLRSWQCEPGSLQVKISVHVARQKLHSLCVPFICREVKELCYFSTVTLVLIRTEHQHFCQAALDLLCGTLVSCIMAVLQLINKYPVIPVRKTWANALVCVSHVLRQNNLH